VLEGVPIILPSPDGSIAVPQSQSKIIRRFDAGGHELDPIGRPGSGPGEFSAVVSVGWKSDSLWAFDGPQNRFSTFGEMGEGGVNTFASHGAKAPPGSSFPSSALVLPAILHEDGSRIGELIMPSWPDGERRRESPIVLIDPAGVVQRVVALLPGDKGEWFSAGEYRGWAADPFEHEWRTASSPDGETFVVAAPSLSKDREGFGVLVRWVDSSGSVVRTRELPVPAVVVPREEKNRVLEYKARRHPPPAQRAALARLRETANEHYPPVLGLSVDSQDVVWIQWQSSPGSTRVTRLDPTDRSASYGVPPGFTLKAAEGGTLWFVFRDDLDVDHILAVRIRG
jgi:hypothetical protein